MPAERVLSIIALVAAIVAAAAVAAFSVRAFLLARRLHELSDEISRVLNSEVRRALAQVEETARGLQQTSGKIDEALVPLEHTLHWAGVLASTLAGRASPALGVLGGVGRALGGILRHGRGSNGGGERPSKREGKLEPPSKPSGAG